MALLGIDIGSTAMKAAAFDEGGRQLGAVRLEYRKPVQDADDWWRFAARAVRLLLRGHDGLGPRVRAVGLSGRGGTRVFLDRGGRPVPAPASLTPSPEAQQRAIELAGSRRGGHGIRFLASLLQFRQDQPHEWPRVARAMVAKDYVVFQLTGHAVTDPASGPDAEDWPEAVRSAPEIEGVLLSEVRWPWQAAGRLRTPVAAALGLPPGIPVATGAHDGVAAAVGAGAAFEGAHPVTLGTNMVYRILSSDGAEAKSRFWTILPGLTAYGADVTLGGYAADWIAGLLGGSHERLSEEASRVPPGSEGVVFLPQMGGRILPEPNPGAAGAFAGLRRGTRPAHMYRAVLEGNAFALRAARDALLGQGLPDGDIYLTGGGSRSPLWRAILAGTFARPVRWIGVEEGCRGAAIFAGVAAGTWRDVSEAVRAMTGKPHVLEPGDDIALYDGAYERFVRVRRALDHA
jgi:xylulokinase